MSIEANTLVQRIRTNMVALRGMTDNLRDAFEAQAEEIDKKERDLNAMSSELDRKISDLNMRELKVARREQEVMNIRQIAADRKAQLETAHQNVDLSDTARRKAEVNQRIAEAEKTKLEETVELLLKGKKRLVSELAELRERAGEVASDADAEVAVALAARDFAVATEGRSK